MSHTVYDFELTVFTEWPWWICLLGLKKKMHMCNLHFILFTSYEKRQRREKELLNTSMKSGRQNAGQEARQRCSACVRWECWYFHPVSDWIIACCQSVPGLNVTFLRLGIHINALWRIDFILHIFYILIYWQFMHAMGEYCHWSLSDLAFGTLNTMGCIKAGLV